MSPATQAPPKTAARTHAPAKPQADGTALGASAHAEAAEHGKHGGRGGHGGHRGREKHEEHPHHGPPPWLISFGDMMTLFLCFFIILVTMAPTQDSGLTAAGLGPFVVALESKGMDGALKGEKQLQRVNMYRERFGLDPLSEDEFQDGRLEARDSQEIEQLLKASLRPYAEMRQPLIARFGPDSAELSSGAKTYLDAMAETLRPGFGQLLMLEGHAIDAGPRFRDSDAWLAVARSQRVKRYLVDQHGFVPQRVEARAWATEDPGDGGDHRSVDARLVEPQRDN